MAWTRTALAVGGCGVLVARQTGSAWAAVVVLVATAAAAGVMSYSSERRYHERGQALLSGDPIVAIPHVLLAATVATALGMTALLTILI